MSHLHIIYGHICTLFMVTFAHYLRSHLHIMYSHIVPVILNGKYIVLPNVFKMHKLKRSDGGGVTEGVRGLFEGGGGRGVMVGWMENN